MKAEARFRRDADPAARDMAEQYRASRLARSDDADVHPARSQSRPAHAVLNNRAAVAVGDIDRLGAGRAGRKNHHNDRHEKWTFHFYLSLPLARSAILEESVAKNNLYRPHLRLVAEPAHSPDIMVKHSNKSADYGVMQQFEEKIPGRR